MVDKAFYMRKGFYNTNNGGHKMNEKDLVQKYADLLRAQQKATLHPDNKGFEWKYSQLNTLYQDTLLKEKVPKEKLAAIEKQGESLYEKYEKEASQYKETYKNDVLNTLNGTKEEKAYKDAYKQEVLAFLDKEQNEKQENYVETDERDKEMTAFESEYGYERVYALKKEVLSEIKEMDLSPAQKERLKEVEKDLEEEKKLKLGKEKKKSVEVEMEM